LTNILAKQLEQLTKAKLEQQMELAKQQSRGNQLSTKLTLARQAERQAVQPPGMSKR